MNFKENNQKRKQSPFIDRIAGFISNTVITPKTAPPAVPEDAPVQLIPQGPLVLQGYQVGGYDQGCERKYLYVHLLEVGGKANTTAFLKMHDAVRKGYQSVVRGGNADPAHLQKQLQQSFASSGLDTHGYVQDYLKLAEGMLSAFLAGRDGRTPQLPVALALSFGQDQIVATPDDVVLEADGRTTYRKVQTGKKREKDQADLGVAALLLAARQLDPHAQVELVYLTDSEKITLDRAPRQLTTSKQNVADAITNVRAGRFSAKRSSFTCPTCPAFFLCGPLPAGVLHKIFK